MGELRSARADDDEEEGNEVAEISAMSEDCFWVFFAYLSAFGRGSCKINVCVV